MLSFKSRDITWFVAFTAHLLTCSLLDGYFVFSVCKRQHILVFSSPLPPLSPSNFLILPSLLLFAFVVCPCRQRRVCEFTNRKEEGLWNLRVPVVAALLPLFLPSSLFLPVDSSGSDTWINMKVAYFFSFCLRIHTLLTSLWRRDSRGEVFSHPVFFYSAH